MECYFCGSTQCPAVATNNRDDCLHCSDAAIEYEKGMIAYLDGEDYPQYPVVPSKAFENGWIDAANHYGPRP